MIANSSKYINSLKEYELDLRGKRIAELSNLSMTRDVFEAVDLADNELSELSAIPKLPRLKTLLLMNNRIGSIPPALSSLLPNLVALHLQNNGISSLSSLAGLSTLRHLRYLSLVDNPVTKLPHYEDTVVFLCRSLRVLDFAVIPSSHRSNARTFFKTDEGIKLLTFINTFINKE